MTTGGLAGDDSRAPGREGPYGRPTGRIVSPGDFEDYFEGDADSPSPAGSSPQLPAAISDGNGPAAPALARPSGPEAKGVKPAPSALVLKQA